MGTAFSASQEYQQGPMDEPEQAVVGQQAAGVAENGHVEGQVEEDEDEQLPADDEVLDLLSPLIL